MSAKRRRAAVGITVLLLVGASTALVMLRRDSSTGIAVRTPKPNPTSPTTTTTTSTSTSTPSTTTTALPTACVAAFQKANGLTTDGAAGPLTLTALAAAERSSVRTTTGNVIEIDLTRQLLLVVADGRVQWTFDTSTGTPPGTTPVGDFTVSRQVNGYDHSPLGVLYPPKYFVGGVAVHGYPSVPPHAASHRCVRVTNAAMDWLWANEAMTIGTHVSVYE